MHRKTLSKSPSTNTSDSHTSRSSKKYIHEMPRRRRDSKGIPQGEFSKARLPTIAGTYKGGPKVEAWLLGMERYFKIHEHIENEKAKISIFNLNGRALIWWEHLIEVKGIK